MRVLHVGKYFAPFAGGIEQFMGDLVPACGERGVDSACVVHASPGNDSEADVRFDAGLDWPMWRVPTYGRLAYAPVSPGFARTLEAALKSFRPELLHIHMPNTSAFWALASRRARALPWVVHWHSDVVGPGLETRLTALYPFYRPFEQALLRRAAAVVATSSDYLNSSRALWRWGEKARVISLGLDQRRLVPPDAPGAIGWSDSGRLRVLGVGRLSSYKGFDVLIRAARELDNVEVIIVGAGARRRGLESMLGADDRARIRLAGALCDGERNRLLADCDVLCLPSINRAEAFGLALVEAMAVGRPVVATEVPGSGMGWVVEHGRTGWLVPPSDATALAKRLGQLDGDRRRLSEAGAAARAAFETRFSINAVADAMTALYGEVLDQ